MTVVTINHAELASSNEIQTTDEPAALKFLIVKLTPRENAMMPSTKLDTKSDCASIACGIRLRRRGPIKIPTAR
jgi:hypothetical protein